MMEDSSWLWTQIEEIVDRRMDKLLKTLKQIWNEILICIYSSPLIPRIVNYQRIGEMRKTEKGPATWCCFVFSFSFSCFSRMKTVREHCTAFTAQRMTDAFHSWSWPECTVFYHVSFHTHALNALKPSDHVHERNYSP